LLRRVGLAIVHRVTASTRVPMWFLVSPCEPVPSRFAGCYATSKQLVGEHQEFLKAMFRAYDECVIHASRTGRPLCVYGTGAVGTVATAYTSLTPDRVEAVFDDNPSIWGSTRMGSKVR